MKKRKRGRPLGIKNKDKLKARLKYIEPEKAKLIKEIWKLQPEYKTLNIDLGTYTLKELNKHIILFKKKQKMKTKLWKDIVVSTAVKKFIGKLLYMGKVDVIPAKWKEDTTSK